MKLTDPEQVILKAIGSGVTEISRVIRAVGYPKATVKKILARLNEKGIVALHRHDYPQSLTPAQRKVMLRLKDGQGRWSYYNAVSMRKRNPKSKGKTALKTTGRALKSFAKGALSAGAQILGAGATALNPHGMSEKAWKAEENKWRKSIAAYRAKGWTYQQIKDRLWLKFGLTLDKLTDESAVFVPIFGRSGGFTLDLIPPLERRRMASKAKKQNPRRRNKTIIKAKRVVVLNPKKKPAKKAVKRRRNASKSRTTKSVSKRRAGASRKTANRSRVRSVAKARKAPAKRASKRAVKRRNPDPKQGSTTKAARLVIARQTIGSSPVYVFKWMGKWHQSLSEPPHHATGVVVLYPDGSVKSQKKNPSAESIRKEFAGSVNGERDLFFPQGTPSGKLAKLGKLVSITTEEGTIKPVSGSAWLCADTKGKLHIGSTSGAPLFDGPKRSFGHVTKLEYESTKPHLGYKGPIIWFHRAGEENGIRPTLHADGKGGIVFRGGDYRLTRRGIEN